MTDLEARTAPAQPEAHRDVAAPPERAARPRPLRCLLVEDSRFDRSLVRYSAARGGVEIDFVDAVTLAEARASLASQDFELIILDRALPDGDGLDLPAHLAGARRNARVPMIMLSGGDADDLAPASARAGCVRFISKHDLSPEGLADAVRAALALEESEETSEELRMLLAALSDVSRVARMKPLASRLMAVVSEVRRFSTEETNPAATAALEELSELCLMLWMELEGADRERAAAELR